MNTYYEDHHLPYFQDNAFLNPTPFLTSLTKRLPPIATVLDVGCGSGRDLRRLTGRGFKPTGLKLSLMPANMAKYISRQKVINGDFISYDFSKLSFDTILLIVALAHLEPCKM